MSSSEIRTKYKNIYFKLEYLCEFHNFQYILLLIIVFFYVSMYTRLVSNYTAYV